MPSTHGSISSMAMQNLLSVHDLNVEFPTRHGTLHALTDVSFNIRPGEVLGMVGESGAGKSLTGAAIIGLLEPPGRMSQGEIWLRDQRIDHLSEAQMRKIRGRKIGAIFQDRSEERRVGRGMHCRGAWA